MKKWTIISTLFLTVWSIASGAVADDAYPIGLSPSGQYGLNRLPIPVAPTRHVSISGHGGYAFTESMGPVSGAHHRLQGVFSVAGAPMEQLSIGLMFKGYHDRHPDDANGADTTTVGTPSITIKGGYRLSNLVQLGGALDIIIPGKDAPSLAFNSTSLEPRLLFALVPENGIWRVLVSVGYRWDNTDKSAPSAASLRPGDRISIGTSKYDAVLIGLGTSVGISATELFAEITSNIFVGSGAPAGDSPFRLGIGARHRVLKSLQISLLTETLLAGRPALGPEDPILPVEPRFALLAGVTYTFDFGKRGAAETPSTPTPESTPVPESTPTPEPEKQGGPLSSIEGNVIDEEGNPIGGARVTYSTAGPEPESFETTTDPTGNYKLTDVPMGEGTLRIEVDGFDPVEKNIQLTGTSPLIQPPETLKQTLLESSTQLRGQIRSIDGKPLKAKLVIKPTGTTVETDDEGYFTVDLPEGTYRVTITARDHKRQKKRVVIEENSVTIINVDLRKK